MTSEPADQIDVRNNRESQAAAASHSSPVARASDGGAPPREAPESGELPEAMTGGAADGDPLAGMTMSASDIETSVHADEGPVEEDGRRGNVGHA